MADSKTKPGLRAWITHYPDGHVGGVLMRQREYLFDRPPPSAYARSEDEVLARLEEVAERQRTDLGRYLWTERFEVRRTRVEVMAGDLVGKEPVVGRRTISFSLPFAWSRRPTGAYRVVLPQFRWWTLIEDLELAGPILSQIVSGALVGARTEQLVDFTQVGEPTVRHWRPGYVERATRESEKVLWTQSAPPTLAAVAEDWVERAAKKTLPPVVGRDPVFEQLFAETGGSSKIALIKEERARTGVGLAQAKRLVEERMALASAFDAKKPSSVLLVGERGVGKTTFLRRLAQRLLRDRREKKRAPRLWASSSDRILAGMTYLGMWQERCLELVQELRGQGDWFYVGRLNELLRDLPGGGQLSSILGPPAEEGTIALLAECTPAELVEAQRRAPRFVAHFRKLHISEPREEELRGWIPAYLGKRAKEEQEGQGVSPVRLEGASVARLLEHSSRFRRDLAFPGKAFHFVDYLAGQHLRGALFPADISRHYSAYSGLPEELIDDSHALGAEGIAARLARRVIGQDDSCAAVARALTPFKVGLQPPEKPVASLLFVGPTGVGKTELAKQIAAQIFGSSERMIRLDMSEYLAPGSARRLLQVGEGVRSLAEMVRRQPLSVVLLDEIEKAHASVFDALLGVLGEGRLTDAAGQLVDFRMTTIVMTSNLGVSTKGPVGFEATESASTHLEAVRRHFRPELFNRIDAVVPFRALEPDDVTRIADVLLREIQQRPGLRERGLTLAVDEAARRQLATLGYDRRFGARPLKRVLEERVVGPLAAKMAAEPELREREVRFVGPGVELSVG